MEVTPQVQNKLPKSPASCSLRGTSKALRNVLLLHAAMSMYFFFNYFFVCLFSNVEAGARDDALQPRC